MDQLSSVIGPLGNLLLEFDDMSPNLPAGTNLKGIYNSQRLLERSGDQSAQLIDKCGERLFFDADRGIGH